MQIIRKYIHNNKSIMTKVYNNFKHRIKSSAKEDKQAKLKKKKKKESFKLCNARGTNKEWHSTL